MLLRFAGADEIRKVGILFIQVNGASPFYSIVSRQSTLKVYLCGRVVGSFVVKVSPRN